jgi:hypothetical protein
MPRVSYKELPRRRRFGVELELSNNVQKTDIGSYLTDFENQYEKKRVIKVTAGSQGWAESVRNTYWHVKYDSTCGPVGKGEDSGWEVASFIGSGSEDIDHISKAAKYLGERGCTTNKNCGLHVHVETTDFDTYLMGVMLARWLKIEAILASLCPSYRWDNEYCQSLRGRETSKGSKFNPMFPRSFWATMQPTDISKHNNMEKRYTLNTVGFSTGQVIPGYNRNTVELRLPDCRLEDSHVRNWTRLFVQFVDASSRRCKIPSDTKPCSSIEEILIYMGLADDDEMYVLDSDLLSLKMWLLKAMGAAYNGFALSQQAKKHLEFISKL